MFRLIKHVLFRHSLPALLIVLIVVFGLSTSRALAPVAQGPLVLEEKTNQSVILAERGGPALFDVQIGPALQKSEKNRKALPFAALGLIFLVSIVYTLVYKKIHHKNV